MVTPISPFPQFAKLCAPVHAGTAQCYAIEQQCHSVHATNTHTRLAWIGLANLRGLCRQLPAIMLPLCDVPRHTATANFAAMHIGAVKCSPNKPTTCAYMQTNKQTLKQVQLRKSRWLTSPLVALCEANRIHPPRGVCVPMQRAFVEVPVREQDVGRTGGLDLC